MVVTWKMGHGEFGDGSGYSKYYRAAMPATFARFFLKRLSIEVVCKCEVQLMGVDSVTIFVHLRTRGAQHTCMDDDGFSLVFLEMDGRVVRERVLREQSFHTCCSV
jgi:hypothetical protein